MSNKMTNNFKVIIAGGGPAGLVAAHSLHLANIDFTVLEARDSLTNDQGASLVLAPQSLRIMNQFGILDRLMEVGAEMQSNTAYSVDGTQLGKFEGFHYLKDNFGSAPVAFHRAQLIDTIYEGLPEEAKAHVFTGKKIVNVASDEEGVEVTCADGSVYSGSVIIGADGVHSRVRRQMRDLALKDNIDVPWDPETPYAAEYRTLWCSFPKISEPGHGSVTYHKDRSMMYIAGKNRGWIFLYEKLPEKTKARVSYSEQDCIDYAQTFGHYPVIPGFTVKDVFAQRLTAGMSNLEEGVVEHWTWGRIALVGDACHKYTPNKGLGFNNGIQDIVELCNELVAAVRAAPNGSPTFDSVHQAFQTYQDERRKLAEEDCMESGKETRVTTYANPLYYFIGHYVYWWKWVQYLNVQWLAPRSIRKGQVLDYVISDERVQGAVSWIHPVKHN